MNWGRIIAVLLVLMFLALFWNDPAGAAHVVGGFFSGLGVVAGKITTFVGALGK